MRFQNPFVVSDEDKAKLIAAKDVVADAFPTVNVGWKPGRKALTAIGKAIPSVKVSWKDKEPSEDDIDTLVNHVNKK